PRGGRAAGGRGGGAGGRAWLAGAQRLLWVARVLGLRRAPRLLHVAKEGAREFRAVLDTRPMAGALVSRRRLSAPTDGREDVAHVGCAKARAVRVTDAFAQRGALARQVKRTFWRQELAFGRHLGEVR